MNPAWSPTLERRFWSKVEKTDTCWMWLGHTGADGYGRISSASYQAPLLTHRVSYELLVGPIPTGLQIDHLCRVRACCNPDHLEAVTQRINILRGEAPSAVVARTGVCQRGHRLTPDNVYIRPDTSRRVCRACAKWRRARRTSRERAVA